MLILLLAVAGCAADRPAPLSPGVAALAGSPSEADRFLSHVTLRRRGVQGLRYDYLGSDHRMLSLLPGRTRVVSGRWAIRPDPGGARFCLRGQNRGASAVNGLPHTNWRCAPLAAYLASLDEARNGDLFDLRRSSVVPGMLPPGADLTIPQALARLGLPPAQGPDKLPR